MGWGKLGRRSGKLFLCYWQDCMLCASAAVSPMQRSCTAENVSEPLMCMHLIPRLGFWHEILLWLVIAILSEVFARLGNARLAECVPSMCGGLNSTR